MKKLLFINLLLSALVSHAQTDTSTYKHKQDLGVQVTTTYMPLVLGASSRLNYSASVGAFYRLKNLPFLIGLNAGTTHIAGVYSFNQYSDVDYINTNLQFTFSPANKFYISGGMVYNLLLGATVRGEGIYFNPFYWSVLLALGREWRISKQVSLAVQVQTNTAITTTHTFTSSYKKNESQSFIGLGIGASIKHYFVEK